MDRRDALKQAACAIAAIAASTVALSDPHGGETKILRLFWKHKEYARWKNLLPRNSTYLDDDSHFAKLSTFVDEMMSLHSACSADFAAKTIFETGEGGCFSDWETGALWKEARALTDCSV